MDLLHISTECYPAAKAGGLGDVVGALPKYQNKAGLKTSVIIPRYQTKWLMQQSYKEVHRETVQLGHERIEFFVQLVEGNPLGYDLYVVDIPGKFDRSGVYLDEHGYAYGDELARYICFQQAVLTWVRKFAKKPRLMHCHDHHTGLIPFLVKYAPEYQALAEIPTIFTIHNGAYHGSFSWDNLHLLPFFDSYKTGLIDWEHRINPLASGIKNSWAFTTVSPGYMEELRVDSNGLEPLINSEISKGFGILNGIDTSVWDPRSDKYLNHHFNDDIDAFKQANKQDLLNRFNIMPGLPIITFIGRLAREKGADLLPDLIRRVIHQGTQVGIIVLGTGEPSLHHAFTHLREEFKGFFDASLEYNEGLAHQLYAGSDYLLMPSRVEPCGLNQMYACRYGTIPVVRSVGGLRDSIPDIGEPDGSGLGIRFDHFSVDDAALALYRTAELYQNQNYFKQIRAKVMQVDFSWEKSANDYMAIYNKFI